MYCETSNRWLQLTQAVVKAIEEAHVYQKARYNSFVVRLMTC